MAFVAPVVAFLAEAAPYIALAGSAYGAYQAHESGIEQDRQMRAQARQVEADGRAQEIDRKRALVKSLSTQNAYAGAAGITTSGSLGKIIGTDIKQATNDLAYIRGSTTSKASSLRAQGRAYRRAGDTQAAVGLFGAAADFGTAHVPKTPTGP